MLTALLVTVLHLRIYLGYWISSTTESKPTEKLSFDFLALSDPLFVFN